MNDIELQADLAAAAAEVDAGTKETFCKYWPIARPVLEALKAYMPQFKIVIQLIISFGDKICSES